MSGQRDKMMMKESQYLQREMTRERAFQELEKVNNIPCCQKVPTIGTGKWTLGLTQKQWLVALMGSCLWVETE